jgi:serine-type D-Ala-D-Ala carboxypeptidase/endopeptidase
MTWTTRAARSLTDALGGVFGATGVVVAAAVVDASGTVTAIEPGSTPAAGRFEIGSVTKTMTATVLALLAGEGVLRLDDEIGRWLSAGPHGGITIRQLATHTSGLPTMAPNVRARQVDPADPWAGYTFELAEEGLRQATVTPGNPRRYSNLGYQLLGLLLQRASGQDYPTLLAQRLFDPLAMTHSGVGQRGEGTLLPGHADGREVLDWAQPLGAGGVTAAIEDLARYARACLFPPDGPLGDAITLAQTPVHDVGDGVAQALGWVVREGGVREHSGGTGGFCACVCTDRGRGRAVAMLVSHQGGPARSAHLKEMARLVLAGGDPRRADAPTPWPAWEEDTREVARLLLDGHVAQVHARLIPAGREKITVSQLEKAWTSRTRQAGPAGEIAVVRHEVAASGAVVADVAITFATGTQRLRILVLPTGELGGFTFLPPSD